MAKQETNQELVAFAAEAKARNLSYGQLQAEETLRIMWARTKRKRKSKE